MERFDSPVVLLVEDEPLVRMVGLDVFEEAGFHVIEAADADQALAVLRSRSDVSVLFTDVEMPGSLDGFALARVTDARWPHVAVLIVSGRARPSPGDMPSRADFFTKPYSPDVIVQRVREHLRALE